MKLEDCEYDLLNLLQTKGLYVVSDGVSLIMCHKCTVEDPRTIALEGDAMFVLYARGDLKALLLHTEMDSVKTIIFQRECTGPYRYLDFQKLYRRLS